MSAQVWLIVSIVAVALALVFFAVYFLSKPIRLLLKIVYNSLFGLLLLWVINTVGQVVGFHVPINFLTVIIVGFLGLPGLLVIVVIRVLLGV